MIWSRIDRENQKYYSKLITQKAITLFLNMFTRIALTRTADHAYENGRICASSERLHNCCRSSETFPNLVACKPLKTDGWLQRIKAVIGKARFAFIWSQNPLPGTVLISNGRMMEEKTPLWSIECTVDWQYRLYFGRPAAQQGGFLIYFFSIFYTSSFLEAPSLSMPSLMEPLSPEMLGFIKIIICRNILN